MSVKKMPFDNLNYSILEDYSGVLLESAQLDLEFSKQLLPSPTRSDVIAKHLTAIRTQFPKMNDIHHTHKWSAGCLVLKDCKKSVNECIELITSEYGPVEVKPTEPDDSISVQFEKPYNPETLADAIASLCECSCSAQVSSLLGVNGNVEINIYGENEAKYSFSMEMEQSSTVCRRAYKHFWKYSVTGQIMNFIVHLENEWEEELK